MRVAIFVGSFLCIAFTGFSQEQLSITTTLHSHADNLEQVCKSTYGDQSYLADWNDVVAIPNIVQWSDSIGFAYNQEVYLRWNGAYFYTSNRHYFMARHNNIFPSGWLIHATINNNFIDLGSWNGPRHVLCKNTQSAPVIGCTDPLSCDYNPNAQEGGAELCSIYPGDTCDDGNSETVNDMVNADCQCVGEVLGCTDPAYCEYNPAASIDDGSCLTIQLPSTVFQPTSTSFTELANPNQQCINEFGPNYRLADWTELEQIPNITQWADSIGYGSMDLFWVQNNGDSFWDGSNRHYLIQRHDGNLPGGWSAHDNINNHFISLGSWYNIVHPALCATNCIEEVLGCTLEEASNYNPNAITNDGSCVVPGCTDSSADNYNIQATEDDGSCEFLGCTDPDADNFNASANVNDNSCIYLGCTDSAALNFNIQANQDDGSCIYQGCTNPAYCEYNPLATIDDGSCISVLTATTHFTVTTTAFTELDDPNQQCINEFGPNYSIADWSELQQIPNIVQWADSIGIEHMDALWIHNNDEAFWNGTNRHYLIERHNGSLPSSWGTAYDNINNYFLSLGSWYGNVQSALCSTNCVTEVIGCNEPEAANYDPTVTTPDDSCIFLGCTNPVASNYNAQANEDDGSCIVLGCRVPVACNYNSEANEDDGSCEFITCLGCTYISATNYSPTATLDDGSCVYSSGETGCTYSNALNYNEFAVVDDGSCEFEAGCLADINIDGVINASDLSLFLSAFGTSCD